MALTRLDALKLLNLQWAAIAPGLDGVDVDVIMLSVWALYTRRYEDALALIAQRPMTMTEEELGELGTFWIRTWGLGSLDRTTPYPCPVCHKMCPPTQEYLCSCFEQRRVGCYINYNLTEVIDEVKRKHPGTWRQLSAEAYVCFNCSGVYDVPLGIIDNCIQKGSSWRTPRYCRACKRAHTRKHPNVVPLVKS